MVRERRGQVLFYRGEREVQAAVDAPEAHGDAALRRRRDREQDEAFHSRMGGKLVGVRKTMLPRGVVSSWSRVARPRSKMTVGWVQSFSISFDDLTKANTTSDSSMNILLMVMSVVGLSMTLCTLFHKSRQPGAKTRTFKTRPQRQNKPQRLLNHCALASRQI